MKYVKVKLKDKKLDKKYGKIVEEEPNKVITEKLAVPPELVENGIVLFRRKRIEASEEMQVTE